MIPTLDQARFAVANRDATALEKFVYERQPSGCEEAIFFRADLARVIQEAVGTKPKKTFVFICRDCGKPPDCPMLHDHVWKWIGKRTDLTCIECAEKKLGRQLTIKDLRPCVGNNPTILMVTRATSQV